MEKLVKKDLLEEEIFELRSICKGGAAPVVFGEDRLRIQSPHNRCTDIRSISLSSSYHREILMSKDDFPIAGFCSGLYF